MLSLLRKLHMISEEVRLTNEVITSDNNVHRLWSPLLISANDNL